MSAADLVLVPGETPFPVRALQVRPQPDRLFFRGDIEALSGRCVAIVGARDPTPYGMRVAWEAAQAVSRAGLVVLSGMARGLDAQAHRAALAAGGRTVAVLGCGLDVAYPRQNRDLREAIPERGALITEFKNGTRPAQWTFPRRNRLIAALAETVLVVEGRPRGGTSNVVEWMNELGRSIWAVPGRLGDPLSDGPNLLIQQGAHLYREPRDLLEALGVPQPEGGAPMPAPRPVPTELTGAEATLFDLMSPDPVHVDDIATRAALDPGLLLAALSTLELQGLVRQLPGKRFALAS